MKKQFLAYCLLMVAFGCEKNDGLNMEPPEIPNAVKFDLNDDGFDDILFETGQDDVLTDGTAGFAGYVYPLNENLVMISTKSENSWIFDNQLNDTIRKGETNSYTWYPSNLGFISIDDSPQGVWPDEWTVSGEGASNPYYLGIQIKENDNFLVGWLKLEINKKTAEVSLIGHKVTSMEFIVIDE